MMLVLDDSIVNIALPSAQRELGVEASSYPGTPGHDASFNTRYSRRTL
jgi:hypothetical protein